MQQPAASTTWQIPIQITGHLGSPARKGRVDDADDAERRKQGANSNDNDIGVECDDDGDDDDNDRGDQQITYTSNI